MFFNLACLVLLEEKEVQLLAGEKVSADLCEFLKGPWGLWAVAQSLHSISFPPELMTLIYPVRSASSTYI